MKKNLDLLRPFDLEAAKAGEAICSSDGDAPTNWFVHCGVLYIEWVDEHERFVSFNSSGFSNWRMAPLAWVEGKPVYPGDVCYGLHNHHAYTATIDLWVPENGELFSVMSINMRDLTWEKPKTTKQVKLLAWFDGYCLVLVTDKEPVPSDWKRVPAEDKVIEVEE